MTQDFTPKPRRAGFALADEFERLARLPLQPRRAELRFVAARVRALAALEESGREAPERKRAA